MVLVSEELALSFSLPLTGCVTLSNPLNCSETQVSVRLLSKLTFFSLKLGQSSVFFSLKLGQSYQLLWLVVRLERFKVRKSQCLAHSRSSVYVGEE